KGYGAAQLYLILLILFSLMSSAVSDRRFVIPAEQTTNCHQSLASTSDSYYKLTTDTNKITTKQHIPTCCFSPESCVFCPAPPLLINNIVVIPFTKQLMLISDYLIGWHWRFLKPELHPPRLN